MRPENDDRGRDVGATACASSSVDSPPASAPCSKRQRPQEGTPPPAKKAKVAAEEAAEATSAPSEPAPQAQAAGSPKPEASAGPAAAELRDCRPPPSEEEAVPPQWGTLISQFPEHPDIKLCHRKLLFGRGIGCHVGFNDPCLGSEVCVLKRSQHASGPKVTLVSNSGSRQLYFNNRNLSKLERVAVHGGDEIMLQGSETYSFIYEPYRPVDAHGPAVITAAMAGAKEAADPSAPEQPFQAAQARVAVSARSSGAAVQPSSLFNAATAGDIAAAADLRDAGLPLPLPFTLGTAHPLMHSRPQPTVLEPRAASGDVYEEASQHAGVVAAATAAAAADPSAVASPITACMLAHGSAADQSGYQPETASGLAEGLANVSVQKDRREGAAKSPSHADTRTKPSVPQAAASASSPHANAPQAATATAAKQPPPGRIVIVPSNPAAAAGSGRGPRSNAAGSAAAGRGSALSPAAAQAVARGEQHMGQTSVAAIQQAARRAGQPGLVPPPGIPQHTWQAHLAHREAAAALAAVPQPALDDVATPSVRHSSKTAKHLQQLTADLQSSLEQAEEQTVSWDSFPHYVSEGTRASLVNTAFLHLQRPAFTRLVAGVPGLSNRVWLTGPTGSELYQEQLIRALAKQMGARVLVFDMGKLAPPSKEGREGRSRAPAASAIAPRDDDCDISLSDDDGVDEWDGGAPPLGDPAATWAMPRFPLTAQRRPLHAPRGAAGADASFRRMAHSRQAALAQLANLPPADATRATQRLMARAMASAAASPEGAAALAPGDRVRVAAPTAAGWGAPANAPTAAGYSGRSGTLPSTSRHTAEIQSAVAAAAGRRGPPVGAVGTVVLTFPGNPDRVGVSFDSAVPGGVTLNGTAPQGHGFFCNPRQLTLESDAECERAEAAVGSAAVDALFGFITDVSRGGPLVVFLKDAVKVLTASVATGLYPAVAQRMHGLASQRVLVVAGHCESPVVKKAPGGLAAMLGGSSGMLAGLDHMLDALPGRQEPRAPAATAASARVTKMLSHMLSNQVALLPPPSEPALSEWNKMLEADMATQRQCANTAVLAKAVAKFGLECGELATVAPSEGSLVKAQAERIVGWALAALLSDPSIMVPPQAAGPRLQIPVSCVKTALATHAAIQAEGEAAGKSRWKDLKLDNDFEKKLLEEVIPPEEVGTTFDDIGALDAVKASLREVVMLPLQRPELFKRGALTKPTKGVLLFGPPGTGKTMLAKAVAAESGASFLNISMSALASKWFGEGEKYVKALFSLAHRLAPAVIFIDEVDSMLSRRDKSNEHEAMRKIKNEFMSNWDGLRTSNSDRVLVLAATNRPGDLDDAVVRRLPRRLLVDLPDAPNRARILKVILKEEQLAEGFNVDELAGLTDGYSGSDLRNLCTAAAYRPIRDLLAREAATAAEAAGAKTSGAAGGAKATAEGAAIAQVATAIAAAAPSAAEPSPASPGVPRQLVPPSQTAPTAPAVPKPAGGGAATPTQAAVAVAAAAGASPSAVLAAAGDFELRPLTMKDMKEAMKQVGASNSTDAVTMNELRQWNELYGEGGSRRTQLPTYFM